MTALLLSVHVLAAIVFIGPVTVAVSLFPRYAREAAGDGPPGALPAVHLLHIRGNAASYTDRLDAARQVRRV